MIARWGRVTAGSQVLTPGCDPTGSRKGSMTLTGSKAVGRREFLRRAGLAAAAGAVVPLVGSSADAASDVPGDPDQLFAAARFVDADRGYARQLRHDPANAHALAQRGYIALLSNRFGDAENFLSQALILAPTDTFTRRQLADCFVRQDQLARAVPLLRQTGDPADAAAAQQYAAITGIPYQIHGAETTRVPIVKMDPLPMIEASANGGPLQHYLFDTGAGSIGFSQVLGDALGLRPLAAITAGTPGQSFTMFHGVLESFRIGEIELRNVPVQWSNAKLPTAPEGPRPVGSIGSVLFYHFLTTLDYAGRGLVLRRKSKARSRKFQAAARHAGAEALPLWLAGTHFPCTLGSLNDFGPGMVSCDTGGPRIGVAVRTQGAGPWVPSPAVQAGIEVDYEHLTEFGRRLHPSISPDRISLGDAVGRHVPGIATAQLPGDGPDGFRFQTIANVTHEFFKPFAVTFDYTDMNLYVTPTVPDYV
ncbi:aspartyl protease family protein [Flindersiella endophytica]